MKVGVVLGFAQRFVASWWAPWAMLAVTGVLHVLAALAGGDPFSMVDLAVYVDGARHLTDGTLYDFFSEPLHLPFTYPTFSAIIFSPMTWLGSAALVPAGAEGPDLECSRVLTAARIACQGRSRGPAARGSASGQTSAP